MRYVTDDAIQDFVSLQHELDCIRDYIDLQRLRLSEKTEVDFSVTGIVENKQIAPLLLMTFVENVFKHGISNHEAGRLVIRIDAKENSIHFYSMNPVYASTPVETRIGTGIANARRRLDFLYPGKHSLDIKEEEKTFVVNLTLHLS
jgi:LytS/YehU family sensor histidine kinase